MFSCKSLLILLLLLAASVGQNHNYKPCKPLAGDTLLRKESCARSFKFLQYVSATVHINVGDNIIGCFYALDRWGDGTGGYAKLVNGGIGYNYVELKIISKFNRGFWFEIEVYGQKPRTCKYLRKRCVNFRTCSHKHIISAYSLCFTLKSFRFDSSLKDDLICRNCLCGLLIDKRMNTCTYIGTIGQKYTVYTYIYTYTHLSYITLTHVCTCTHR
jgi:hypothetical protein